MGAVGGDSSSISISLFGWQTTPIVGLCLHSIKCYLERETEAPKRTVYPTNTQQALAVDQHVCGLLPFISLMLPSTLGATWRN